MPSFTRGGAPLGPFGKNVYLRSTKNCQFESYTFAKQTMPYQSIDGTLVRVLQPGTAIAKITSGPDSGKVGPFQAAGTAEVQTITPTTVTAGTFTLTITNPITSVARTTAAIAFNATAATVQAALEALDNVEPGDILVAGGPANTTPLTVTFYGAFIGNPAQMTVDNTNLTGTEAVTTTTPGVAGALDGRQTLANVVGLNDTWLPWQLMEHDENIAVLYHGTAVQGWCFEMNAAGLLIALTNTQADGMRSVKGMDITFH